MFGEDKQYAIPDSLTILFHILVSTMTYRNLNCIDQRLFQSSNVRTDIQEKVEVTSENETASNHSTDYVAGVERNDNNTEKGSDTQVRMDLLMMDQM